MEGIKTNSGKREGIGKLKDEDLSEGIIGCAIRVHRELGPGLLESIYEEALAVELGLSGYTFVRQLELPVMYRGVRLHENYRLDLLVEDRVVVELKAVQQMAPVFEAQLLTYMKLGGWKLGLLFNFCQPTLREGFKRLVL